MTRLVASDIDGTLLPAGSLSPPAELLDLLARLYRKGIVVALSSGRPYFVLKATFSGMSEGLTYIACNGAHIVDGDQTSIVPVETAELLKVVRRLPYEWNAVAPEQYLFERELDEKLVQMAGSSGIPICCVPDISASDRPILQVSVICPEGFPALLSKAGMETISERYTIVSAGGPYVDIVNKQVSKGNAVRFLQEKYHIAPEETVVFGDSPNDVSMFEVTPNSFAVETAPASVRERAKHTVKPPEQNGVFEFLLTLLEP